MVLVIVSKSVCDSKLKHINTQCLAAICAHVLPYQNENLQHVKKTREQKRKDVKELYSFYVIANIESFACMKTSLKLRT